MTARGNTSEQILDLAERLVQTRGYSGFSYADIADRLGIRKASVHHHFPSKADLALAIAVRHRAGFAGRLAALGAATPDPRERLERYVALYRETLASGDHMCMYGMLAADVHSLPQIVRDEVNGFFRDQEEWLSAVLAAGSAQGGFRLAGSPAAEARLLLAGLEGAMLVARARGDVEYFEGVGRRMVAGLVRGARTAEDLQVTVR